MTDTKTPATPVIELTADEHERFLDAETRRRLDMPLAEFRCRYRAGELDDSDPDVGLLAVLTAIGQNSEQASV